MPEGKPTPSELRSQAPVVGAASSGSVAPATDLAELGTRVTATEASLTALAPVLDAIDEPAVNLADVTGGAATTDTDDEARAAIDAIKAVLVTAGLMEPEEE